MFFDSWEGMWQITIVGILAYIYLIALVRFSGKRTLSKMNAFDLIVTVALGSTFATILLSKDVPLADGLLVLSLLVFLQFIVAWSSVRFAFIRNLVKSEPTLLYFQGHMLRNALYSQRVSPEEVRAAIRSQGISQLSEVECVILETDGSFSVIKNSDRSATTVSDDVANYPPVS